MTGERDHQICAVGKVQVHRLAGQARGLGDLGHGHFGVAALANQPQRGFQDAVPGTRP